MPLDLTTPAQRRLVDELLAWSDPRPTADLELAPRLRALLESGIEPHLDGIPDGEQIFVGKSGLEATVCDGRYLDLLTDDFTWNAPVVRGKLAHRAVELDWRTDRVASPDQIVGRAWEEMATDTGSLPDFLNGLTTLERRELAHQAEQLLTEFRDTWPVLPAVAHPRLEATIRVTLGEGKVVLSGTPDLTLGRVCEDVCRMLVVDFKTGIRRPELERQELRFYALLATLKYGVAPFRWASYYVTEGAWDLEDLSADLLETAVRRVVDGVGRMVRLRFHTPSEDALRLRGGSWCRFCGRAPTCPSVDSSHVDGRAAPAAPMSQGSATIGA